jgi:hypothetical protein
VGTDAHTRAHTHKPPCQSIAARTRTHDHEHAFQPGVDLGVSHPFVFFPERVPRIPRAQFFCSERVDDTLFPEKIASAPKSPPRVVYRCFFPNSPHPNHRFCALRTPVISFPDREVNPSPDANPTPPPRRRPRDRVLLADRGLLGKAHGRPSREPAVHVEGGTDAGAGACCLLVEIGSVDSAVNAHSALGCLRCCNPARLLCSWLGSSTVGGTRVSPQVDWLGQKAQFDAAKAAGVKPIT